MATLNAVMVDLVAPVPPGNPLDPAAGTTAAPAGGARLSGRAAPRVAGAPPSPPAAPAIRPWGGPALAAATGLERKTVRRALGELRAGLGLDQAADIVVAARAIGLLDPATTPRVAGTAPAEAVPPAVGAAAAPLTPGELALLRAMAAAPAAGSTGWAVELGITASRVRARLTDLRQKLGVDPRADLLQVARERGLLPQPAGARSTGRDGSPEHG